MYVYYIEHILPNDILDDCLHGNEVIDLFDISVSEIHAHNNLQYNSYMECVL